MIIIYESYVCIWSWSSYTSLSYHCPTLMYLATTCHKKTNRHKIKMNQADMIFEVYYNPKATCTTPPSVFTPPKSFQHVTRKAGSITDQVKPSALANKALVSPCPFPYASHLLSLEVPTWNFIRFYHPGHYTRNTALLAACHTALQCQQSPAWHVQQFDICRSHYLLVVFHCGYALKLDTAWAQIEVSRIHRWPAWPLAWKVPPLP